MVLLLEITIKVTGHCKAVANQYNNRKQFV